MTSKALATLKRMFGIGSFDNSRRGPITSVLTISRLREGDMVCNIYISCNLKQSSWISKTNRDGLHSSHPEQVIGM